MALKRLAYTLPSAAICGGRGASRDRRQALTSRRVATVSAEGLAARLSGAAVGADLGGSSKYSSEALED
jgi:hypothetical protein